MDHLPKPLGNRGAPLSDLVFPCLCDPDGFDNGPLETYPERKGFRLNYWDELKFANTLTLPDGSRPSIEQSTILLQEWLFFGLLRVIHSIYGSVFEGNDYVKDSGGKRVLTLEKLSQHAGTWFELEADKPKKVRQRHLHEVVDHLMRALRFLTNNFTALTHGSVGPTGPAYVVSDESRVILESHLEILLIGLLEAMDSISKTIYFRERRNWGSAPESVCLSMRGLMNQFQWCPSELNFVSLTFDNNSYFFASRVLRETTGAWHSHCTSNKCVAFHLEQSTYQTAHTRTCQGCSDITIESADLQRILEKDGSAANPRVKIVITDRDEVEVSLTDEGDYVAISHVWSDGLGHPPGVNSLPECQLRRLRRLIEQTGLPEPIVWVDSLCVPAEEGRAKRNALARMANVYRSARNVLVLDSDLLSTPSSCCNEELLLRIALSKWMRRLWTLEEGVLSRPRLLFQFSDRSIPLPSPHYSVTDSIAFNCMALLSQYLPVEIDILSVITALHFRTTSWSADEPLCIGYILDLDVSSIININEPRLRMVELYRLLAKKDPVFPWQFLFTDEEKLNISPFRWAPLSLLNLEPYDVRYLQGGPNEADLGVVATQMERGLQFQGTHPSCLLSFDEGQNINKCMMIRIGTLSYVLCPVRKGRKCRSQGRFWKGADMEKCLNTDPRRDWTESWRANYGFRPTGNWGLVYSRGAGYGVMVAIEELKDRVLYATLIGQVHMYEIQTSHSSTVSGFNRELWGQLGLPMLDEEEVSREQERMENEIFDDRHYSRVNCVHRFDDDVTWCIG